MKKYIISIAIILALPALVLAYFQPATLTNGVNKVAVYTQETAQRYFGQGYVLEGTDLGAAAGTTHVLSEIFLGGISFGRALATSTSGTATVLKSSELNQYSTFVMTPNTASFTYTLPATSTLIALLKNPGDSKTWTFINATTTAATTFTLAKGTGWNLTGVDANVDVIAGAAWGSQVNITARCIRQPDKDILCNLTENIAVD